MRPSFDVLHGWGLSGPSYAASLERLAGSGASVYAPSLPGFGGTDPLRGDQESLRGYARWVADFVHAVPVDTPATVVGHSMGGAIAVQLTHDAPELVDRLILVNSVGGNAWCEADGTQRAIQDRPLRDWCQNLGAEAWSRIGTNVPLPGIVRDALPNVLRHPAAAFKAGTIARSCDLTAELRRVHELGTSVWVLWSDQDAVVPASMFSSLCSALGQPDSRTVPGDHCWMIEQPQQFADLVAHRLR